MHRRHTSRRHPVARLVLALLLVVQSSAALAAPPAARPGATPRPKAAMQTAPAAACPAGGCATYLPLVAYQESPRTPEPPAPPAPPPAPADTQPPSVPTGMRATGTTDSSAGLAWDAATDDTGVAGYEIYSGAALVRSTAATSTTIGGLLPHTTYTFAVAARDAAGNLSAKSAAITVTTDDRQGGDDTQSPGAPANLRSTGRTHGTIDLAWDAPAGGAVVQYDIYDGDTWLGATAATQTTLSGLMPAQTYELRVTAADVAGNTSARSEVLAVATQSPPEPATLAPAGDQTVVAEIAGDTAFLYTGANPIQVGVWAGTIKPERAAVVRGKVITRDGAPLEGVHIGVVGHPEYGATASRADGAFDLAVNGGGALTIDYAKEGFLPAQRHVGVPWRDYAWLPEVALVLLDPAATAVTLGDDQPLQVAAGSVVSDSDGLRQAVLFFPAQISATLDLADGTQQSLATLHVRATEYTVGERGRAAMPGSLPANSGYTYAVEYSVDEAIALDARAVRFSQPVVAYVENFLGFPVGGAVPAGAYDRERGAWIPAESGRVVKIVGVAGGRAELDLDGDGWADDPLAIGGTDAGGWPESPSALGITEAELEQLARRYTAGQELWRVPIAHFSPWDYNWPFGPPRDAVSPNGGDPRADRPEENPCLRDGSIIECQNQTLGEQIDLIGTPYRLRYTSERAPGHGASPTLRIPLSGPEIPASLRRIELTIDVAGRQFQQTFAGDPNQSYVFTWDRRDAYGRLVQGWHDATVRVGYVYGAIYQAPIRFGDNGAGVLLENSRARQEVIYWKTWREPIGGFDLSDRGLGGWSLDVHHTYDPGGKVVYLGDGGRQSANTIGPVVTAVDFGDSLAGLAVGPDGSLYFADQGGHMVWRSDANGRTALVRGGYGTNGAFSGDGGPAAEAQLHTPTDVAIGPDDSVYIADFANHRVRRIGTDGIITTVAGTSSYAPMWEGQPAVDAWLCGPSGVEVGPDGSLYIADSICNVVYRVGPDGAITTFAGGGGRSTFGYDGGDDGPATGAFLSHPNDIALGPDGSLYIADSWDNRVRRVGTDGIITTVAGSGPTGVQSGRSSGDGSLATSARLNNPMAVAIGRDGSLYIADYRQVRWVGPDGVITTVAASPDGMAGYQGNGSQALRAGLGDLRGIAVAPDGNLFLAVQYYRHPLILHIAPAMPGFATHDVAIPSADGSQVYQFDAAGRHLRTLDALTGAPLYTFAYDPAGRLERIADRDGLVTVIERSVQQGPPIEESGVRDFARDDRITIAGGQTHEIVSIVAPYGQRTTLALDDGGYVGAATNPAGETTGFTYTPGGLLASMADPRGGIHTFEYDELGRLTRDTNPAGGYTALARVDHTRGYTVTLTNALGDTTSMGVESLPTGGQRRITIAPNGATTTSTTRPDGSQISVDALGNTTTVVQSPDPRWGMQAPLVASITMRTASGRIFFTQTATRSIVRSSDGDPLSLDAQTDTITTNGRTTTSVYSAFDHTITTTDPAGKQTVRTLDERGRAIAEQTTGMPPRQYVYDAQGRLTRAVEGDGADARATTLSYNPAGELASSTDPLGGTTTFEYDSVGRAIRQTLPTGHALTFAYDRAGNRIAGVDAQGLRTAYEYDLQNRLTAITRDPGGRAVRTEFQYDAADNLLARVEDTGAGRLNVTARYSYTPVGSRQYAVATVVDPLGQQTSLAYTIAGALHSATDPLGHTTSLTYTAEGWLSEVTTPGGHTTRTDYDAEGRPVRVTDPRGSTTESTYDAAGRLETVTAGTSEVDGQPALNQRTTYDYDANGRVVRVTDPRGSATRTYDDFGRPATIADPLGNTITFAYDALDRLVRQTAGGNTPGQARQTAYTYDAAGRPLTIRVDPDGLNLVTQYRYARAGSADTWSLQEIVDPRGSLTAFHYDSLGQRDQTIDALGQVWRFDYDNLGRLTRQTDPLGRATTFAADSLGRTTSLTEDGRTQRWSYGADGTLASATDFAGRVTSFGYDADGRATSVDYPAGTPDAGYAYDAAGNLLSMTDGLGTTSYGYDALNRPIARTRDGRTVGYIYDAAGETTSIDYWGQGSVAYAYDAAGRLTGLTPWGADPTSYEYGSAGQLAAQTRGNGVTTTYGYDSAGRLIDMLHVAGATNILAIQYALDAGGNRTRVADGDGVTSYSYDALNRLTDATYPAIPGGPAASSAAYTFDPAGNRTGDGTASFTYDASNRIASPGFSYDDNGNLLSDGAASYEYDAANRLVKTIRDGITTTYGYDGNGNLIRETAGGVTTDFVLDERGPLARLLGEVRSDGTELRYAYGPDGIAAQQTISATTQAISYPLLDAQGSVRRLVDAGGAVTLSRSYDAFGAIRQSAGSGWTPLDYTGERAGPDGTIYLRARHYSPALGRFLQRDSYPGTPARPQSLNRYAYAENNPATYVDPSGHCISYLWGSRSCRPIWETGQGINIKDGKTYWWSVAKSAVGILKAPVDLAHGLWTNPRETLREVALAPFKTLHNLYLGFKCDDMELLASSLVNAGAFAIGAAEGLERAGSSAVEDGSLSIADLSQEQRGSGYLASEVETSGATTSTISSKGGNIAATGHGGWNGEDYVTLREGQSVTLYGEPGDLIEAELGTAIEYAVQTGNNEILSNVYSKTYGPGSEVYDLTLYPLEGYGPPVRATKGALTVETPTQLSAILDAVEDPINLHWAACLACKKIPGEIHYYPYKVIPEAIDESMRTWRNQNLR